MMNANKQQTKKFGGAVLLVALLMFILSAGISSADVPGIAIIQKDIATGFSNGGWCADRYENLKPLDANSKITVADINGPAVIKHIHTTRHYPEEIMSRGIVIEIWFDNANEPAVMCPLADFFGDGCNGKSMNFTSNLIECAPWSYNCYFTMPFKTNAKVILRNDTNTNTTNYSYVEWESLPKWDKNFGYFHATYSRKCFQLTKDTKETFFTIRGTGHLLGRQFSIITDEPVFKNFDILMEGNNEVDIDGRERAIDYLGTEDSFTFSWGFQDTFAGQHAGMPFISKGLPYCLSIYRFHDYMPIRFDKFLSWSINWRYEKGSIKNPDWAKAVVNNGCWVDYATVYYWYQDTPGGYNHRPLNIPKQRQKLLLKSSIKSSDKIKTDN